MSPDQFNFLVNSGIAGLFAIFALLLFDKFTKYIDAQTENWKGFLEAQRKDFIDALSGQRESHHLGIARITEEVRANTVKIGENRIVLEGIKGALDSHADQVKSAIPSMRDGVDLIKAGVGGQKEKSRPQRQTP